MKKMFKLFIIIVYVFIILSCGENKNDVKIQSVANDFRIPDKKMCELLTKEMISSVTNISFNEVIVTVNEIDKNSGKYVSQCGYYFDGGNIGVLVRRFGNTSFPKSKEKLIGASNTGDAELDSMMNQAVKTSKAVNDLGDAAFFYDLSGIINLIVVFKEYYQIQISVFGKNYGFEDKTLDLIKKIALKVIEIINDYD